MRNPAAEMRLEDLAAQASSLAMMLYGVGGDNFRSMFARDQDNVLWLLSDLIHEIDGIANGGVNHD